MALEIYRRFRGSLELVQRNSKQLFLECLGPLACLRPRCDSHNSHAKRSARELPGPN
jgi:hypothetical protein